MTVPSDLSQQTYTGIVDGVPLNFNTKVENATHIVVVYGNDVVATLGVDYSVTLAPPTYASAQITPLAGFALLSGGDINVSREVPVVQTLAIPTLATLAASRLEQGLDYVTYIGAMVRDFFDRALTYRRTDPASSRGPLPSAADRAGRYMAFDVNGRPIAISDFLGGGGGGGGTAFGQEWISLADAASGRAMLDVLTTTQINAAISASIPKNIIDAAGDMIYGTASDVPARLAIGATGARLTVVAGVPAWVPQAEWETGDYRISSRSSTSLVGWLKVNDGTIGNAASGGTARANADTAALFTHLYNTFSNSVCPVSGGRGANAAADYAADKTIRLSAMLGRALVVAGAGSGLTTRVLGAVAGTETHTHTGTTDNSTGGSFNAAGSGIDVANMPHTHPFTTDAGSSMQPSTFVSVFIHL